MSKPTYEKLEKGVEKIEKAAETFTDYKEKHRCVFSSAATSIFIVDKDGYITGVNPYYVKNIGKGKTTAEDYLGKNLTEHPSIVKTGLSKLYNSVLNGETFEKRNIHFPSLTGGRDGYFNIKGSPLKRWSKVIGAVFVHEDVTEIKRQRDDIEERTKNA